MIVKRLTADNDDIDLSNFSSLKAAVLVAGDAADASVVIYDGRTVSGGRDVLTLKAVQKTTDKFVCPCGDEIPLKNGGSVDITGSGAILYLYLG